MKTQQFKVQRSAQGFKKDEEGQMSFWPKVLLCVCGACMCEFTYACKPTHIHACVNALPTLVSASKVKPMTSY